MADNITNNSNQKFRLCLVHEQYSKYLLQYDSKVSWKKDRPFLAFAVYINGRHYAIPITSQTFRHDGRRRNQETTTEICYNKQYYGAILYNNMIPVINDLITHIDIDNQSNFQKDRLMSEVIFIRKNLNHIIKKAENVYCKRVLQEKPFFVSFCCDFKLLEQKCVEYCKAHNLLSPIQSMENEKLSIINKIENAKSKIDLQH